MRPLPPSPLSSPSAAYHQYTKIYIPSKTVKYILVFLPYIDFQSDVNIYKNWIGRSQLSPNAE